MKAMILAAGRGERMRPLTDHTPKPLLTIAGTPLIVHLINALRKAGIRDIVINLGHLGQKIVDTLGDGSRYDATIHYSREPPGALDTGGGIFKALPLLGNDPFIVCNGDIWTDYPFDHLPESPDGLAHLVLVDNPAHVPDGNFALQNGKVRNQGTPRYTFGCIQVLHPELFASCRPGIFSTVPLLRKAADADLVSGEYYGGIWQDIGTPERLRKLNQSLEFRC